MNKKLYIQPETSSQIIAPLLMQKDSWQVDDNGSEHVGEEGDEEDDFGSKSRNPWENQLW